MRASPAALFVAMSLFTTAADADEAPRPIVRTATEGNVRLTVELDRSEMWIDEPLRLAVRVEAPSDHAVELPELQDDLGPLLVVGQRSAEPETAAGTTTWKRTYALEAEGIGELSVPPLAITWRRGDRAAAQRLATTAMVVTVRSVMPDDATILEPRGIAPPVELRASGPPAWPWTVAAVALALAAAAWLAWRRRRRDPSLAPARPAHLAALDLLDRLAREDLIGRERVEEFYTRLSGILRHYAAWRFGLPAPARTTEEVLGQLRAMDGPLTAHGEAVSALLAESDLVKFARHRPAAARMVAALGAAREVIERTADPGVLVGDVGVAESRLA